MKLSKRKLQRIIREEVKKTISEQRSVDEYKQMTQQWCKEIGLSGKSIEFQRGSGKRWDDQFACVIPRSHEYSGFKFVGPDNFFGVKYNDDGERRLIIQLYIVPPNLVDGEELVQTKVNRSGELEISFYDETEYETLNTKTLRNMPNTMTQLLQTVEKFAEQTKRRS